MLPTVTPRAQMLKETEVSSAFRAAFSAHLGVSHVRVATAKTVPSRSVSPSDMGDYAFYTPSDCVCPALIVDVDRSFAVLDIFDTFPDAIRPSWVIETPKGAQAGWFIDQVDLREDARAHPKRYARAVGTALRAAVNGDSAVDPVSAARVRNPSYKQADTHAAKKPKVYRLGELHRGLEAEGLWAPEKTLFNSGRPMVMDTGVIPDGERNQRIFDACRFAAYRGGDSDAAAWKANDRCSTPLSASEVHGIIRSVDRFMARKGNRGYSGDGNSAMPESVREWLSEMGRRGGMANTPAQQAARALGRALGTVKLKTDADDRARQAQVLRAKGLSRPAIREQISISITTLWRYLKRYVTHESRVSFQEHQVVDAVLAPAGSSENELPRVKAGRVLRESTLSRRSRCTRPRG